ncbi:MAG: hypothetical protein CL760_00735 [Chloroflexi bacterium]|nr:hypothetical protein [Chloroflexota bacterium]|tara:strand:- start:2074 stop:2301 length:228 start_codon:yes stop_codon:yes gene_type:complete
MQLYNLESYNYAEEEDFFDNLIIEQEERIQEKQDYIKCLQKLEKKTIECEQLIDQVKRMEKEIAKLNGSSKHYKF